MVLRKIEGNFSVCKIADVREVCFEDDFCFLGKTDEELSLVCRTDSAPENTDAREDGWKAFRVEGTLDFSLIGILSRISSILAENRIGIFVVSTYNTDYILTKEGVYGRAISLLAENGYEII